MKTEYPGRALNYTFMERQTRERSTLAVAMPNTLIIEPGAVCSLSCTFCPQADSRFDFSRQPLTLENFKKIIDYFEEFVDTVLLFNWGEPLMNPALPRMAAYASEKGMFTVVHSNLNLLTKDKAVALIEAGTGEIVASIDGASEETYQAYRRGGSFRRAIENLRMLLQARSERGLKERPRIVWKFLVFRHNEHEMEKARRMAEEMGLPIDFKFAVSDSRYSSTIPEYSCENMKEKFLKHYGLPCEQLWRAPTIHADGTVLPCCMVSQSKYGMGNLLKDDFRDIWNNRRYQFLRDVVAGRKEADESVFCYHCMFGKNETHR